MGKIISYKIDSRVLVSIKGNNVGIFIIRLNKNNIDIYKIIKKNNELYEIIISYFDYEKLLKLNTIYEIKIENYLGLIKNKKQFIKYYHLIIVIFLCMIGLYFISNLIFDVVIVTNDKKMEEKLLSSLEYYDIKKYKFIKKYKDIQKIKEKIINDYKDEIQWLEIERVGTKYIVKYESRIEQKEKKEYKFQHVVARKNANILKIYSAEGQIVKSKYSYVKKGDIIISGYIYLNDKIQNTVKATGTIYGQTWYVVRVSYPFNYYEERKTGREKSVYSIKVLNNSFEIFNFNKFNDKIIKENVLIRNKILPIKIVKEYQEEIVIKTSMDDIEQVKLNAINLAYEKINKGLSKDEYIMDHKILNSIITNKGIEMEVFFSICENIGEYKEIEEMKEVE